MKKKITFKMFCSVLGKGLWQAVCWVGGMFGIKDGSTLGKFAKRVFMVSIAAIALMFAVAFGIEFVDHLNWKYGHRHGYDESDMTSRIVGEDYSYYTNYWRPGYIKNNITGETVLKDLVWFYEPAEGDSLAVYKTNADQRGYFNIYTGEVQIPPQFAKAWMFSNGLASVMKDGKIIFINSNGAQAFDKTFRYPRKTGGYVFHGSYCAVETDDGKLGLIDKSGEWVLAPEYDYISPYDNKWWVVVNNDKEGIVDNSLTWILPVEYENIDFSDRGDGVYASRDGVRMKYDFSGNVIEDFVVTDTRVLMYDTDEYNDEGSPIMKNSNCMAYQISYNREGLMSADGKPLTKALYYNISALSPNCFKAEMESGEAVILNEKGNIIN